MATVDSSISFHWSGFWCDLQGIHYVIVKNERCVPKKCKTITNSKRSRRCVLQHIITLKFARNRRRWREVELGCRILLLETLVGRILAAYDLEV